MGNDLLNISSREPHLHHLLFVQEYSEINPNLFFNLS